MSLLDKVMYGVAPGRLEKRMIARENIHKMERNIKLHDANGKIIDLINPSAGGHEATNSGYSHGGASRKRKWAKLYDSKSGSAKEDIEKNRKLLRERSRDLSMNSPLGAAAVGTVRTNCIGQGLLPKPRIDYEFLDISKEEARELEKKIRNEFSLWAESTLCDNNDQNNFYELQQIAFMDWLRNGEEFVLIKYGEELSYMPYQLRLKLVEADRISTPGSLDGDYDGFDEVKKNGSRIVNGVEISKDGKVEAYYISSKYPNEDSFGDKTDWKRVVKRGKETGNPNILHIFNAERAEQYRGVPFLAPVIESVKQLSRYTEAEIMAAVLNSMFAIFITTENVADINGFGGDDEEEDDDSGQREDAEDDDINVGTGTVHFLKTGEGVQAVSVRHPSQNFDGFTKAMAKYIGAALEISPEVLLKEFKNNFSASKGAMNESWRAFKMRRKWFVDDFCQEVYMLWLSEAVSKGRIHAPGFFNNPMIRKAYSNCRWNGPTQGQIDPGKEVKAAAQRVKEGFTTREDECAAMNGSDFEDNVRTLEKENQMLRMANGVEKEETVGGNNEKD